MRKIFLSLALLGALNARAYVTSAILEYTCDDQAAFYLNGSPILERSQFAPFNYEVLSTSDGTLPMELFNITGDNILAVENYDVEGYNMSISYRFTVHTSDGDPIVIWSMPDQAKMLHLPKTSKDPSGWTSSSFDDSSWKPATVATALKGPFDAFCGLKDPAFSGFLGTEAFVPRLSHIFNMNCNTGDHNLFRSHFKFPDHPGKVNALVNPPKAVTNQQVAVRLIPGPDSAEFSQFNILAWLPQGLDLVSASKGGQYDQKLRRIAWNYGSKDLDVRYAKMGVASVVSASGWQNPEKVLGREKSGKLRRKLNTPDAIWNDGAVFTANREGWFKMEPHNVDLKSWRPIILGVIFHSQMKLGGQNSGTVTEADSVRLNYSVDGSMNGALSDDVEVSRMTSNQYWIDGYYDATEDRKWTWEELSRLQVKVIARARGNVDRNLLSSVVATVKYYTPAKASPYFYARVSDPKCEVLKLEAGTFRAGSPLTSSDPVELPVNVANCPATPTPLPTETPIPKAVMRIPTPMPPQPTETPGLTMAEDVRFHLGCLSAAPEPFSISGTFISFCNKKEINVTLNVYASSTGRLVRQIKPGTFRAADNNQVFFNSLGDDGRMLSPGEYVIELMADKNGHKELRNMTVHIEKKARK